MTGKWAVIGRCLRRRLGGMLILFAGLLLVILASSAADARMPGGRMLTAAASTPSSHRPVDAASSSSIAPPDIRQLSGSNRNSEVAQERPSLSPELLQQAVAPDDSLPSPYGEVGILGTAGAVVLCLVVLILGFYLISRLIN